LRDTTLVAAATTLSGLSVNDFFVLSNTNVTIGSTVYSFDSSFNRIGIATNTIDTIYQVESAQNYTTSVVGVGTTVVRRVFAKISGISTVNFDASEVTFDSNVFKFDSTGSSVSFSGIITTSTYFGNYSWGRVDLHSRSEDLTYDAYGDSGFVGIKTSAIVQRSTPLKSQDYT